MAPRSSGFHHVSHKNFNAIIFFLPLLKGMGGFRGMNDGYLRQKPHHRFFVRWCEERGEGIQARVKVEPRRSSREKGAMGEGVTTDLEMK